MPALRRACSPAGGQRGPEAVWARRVAGRKAWNPQAPILAQAEYWCLCRRWAHPRHRAPTVSDADDGSQIEPLLDQVEAPFSSFTAMEPTIGPVSTAPSPSVIPMLRSLFHPDQRRC